MINSPNIDTSMDALNEDIAERTPIQDLFYPQTIIKKYSVNHIYIGTDVDTGKPIKMDVTESLPFIVIGSTGSGKSFLVQSILTRAVRSNGHISCVPTDIKPEYFYLYKPLQAQFHKYLAEHDNPNGIKTRMYYPFFLTKLTKKRYKDSEPIQLSFDMCGVNDFLSLMNFENLTPVQQSALPLKFNEAKSAGIHSFSDFLNFVNQDEQIVTNTKKSIEMSIANLLEMQVIGDEYSDFSFIDDINNGVMPTLNLYGWNLLGRNTTIAAAFVAVILRQLMDAKAQRKVPRGKKLWIIIDEAPRFAPRDGSAQHPSLFQLREMIDLVRQYQIILGLCTQKISKIHKDIVSQCRYIFIPQNIGHEEAKDLFKEVGFYTDQWTFGSIVSDMLHEMRSAPGKHTWKIIDTKKSRDGTVWSKNFNPYAPLGYHREE